MKEHRIGILLFVVTGAFILSACSFAAKATSTPTPTQESLDLISTQAAQTAFVQLTQLALTLPATAMSTDTPVMTPTATYALSTRTQAPPPVTSCARSTFVSDVTIPDGTQMTVGQVFTKTWRVTNSGSCTWTTSFKLAFSSGEAMGGKTAPLANSVPVGQNADLSVKLTVPNKTGTLTGWWVLLDDTGQQFGVGLSVVINVGVSSPTPTGTLTTTPTWTRTPLPGTTLTPTRTATKTLIKTSTRTPTKKPPTPTATKKLVKTRTRTPTMGLTGAYYTGAPVPMDTNIVSRAYSIISFLSVFLIVMKFWAK